MTAIDTGGCRADLQGTCSLATLGVGCCGKVVAIEGENELRQTLRSLGLSDGTLVECVNRAQLGSPVEFRIGGELATIPEDHARRV